MKFITRICWIFLKLFKYLFIFSCIGSLLQHVALHCGMGLLSSCGSWLPEHVDCLVVAHVLSWGIQSSLTLDEGMNLRPWIGRQIPNHWTPRKVPFLYPVVSLFQIILLATGLLSPRFLLRKICVPQGTQHIALLFNFSFPSFVCFPILTDSSVRIVVAS